MNILIPIVKNFYEMSDTIKAALISAMIPALISIIGFIATNRSVKRDFKNEILKQRNEIALNKMATMPMRILELLGTIIETGGQNEELAKEFDGFMNEVYAYGSENAIALISKIQKDNMFFGDNVADRNLYELIAMYILLATQIKYDVTGIIVSPEKWYEMRMNDYEINREKMRLANNNVVKMFELNKRFYIKKIR
jgi:hypothetical protein|nr:MAG: hypothetical protein [Bacteriophage sp.]UWG21617.1 MAG: hypothetical protein [Bacteriophage sp.]DAE80405.1 MAG TPA: hypothetical protein [Caudoviricetes sp.]DAL90691.1 MAG TPA: hypothetical protein [Caudoviricetes sp.]DAO13263.1 MAG TPA: hypothetical protein [Caudoviricetes sp.]